MLEDDDEQKDFEDINLDKILDDENEKNSDDLYSSDLDDIEDSQE